MSMRVFHGFDNLPKFKNPIVTVGSYDGVHAGHRVLLGRIIEQAHASASESVVITFSPHPRTVLDPSVPKIPLLNSLKEKTMLLDKLGIDNLIIAPFTYEFSMVSSYDFVRDYLIGRVGVRTLVVGYNHHFGHNKEGNFNYLYALQDKFGFDICEVPRQQVDNDKVSSTVVRHQIEQGQMAQAMHSLTEPYFMVCRIDLSGNILLDEPNKLLPPEGTYPVRVAGLELKLIISQNGTQLDPTPKIASGSDFIVQFV